MDGMSFSIFTISMMFMIYELLNSAPVYTGTKIGHAKNFYETCYNLTSGAFFMRQDRSSEGHRVFDTMRQSNLSCLTRLTFDILLSLEQSCHGNPLMEQVPRDGYSA